MNSSNIILEKLKTKFVSIFGHSPETIAYAPGRIEILGNHTDYNEGFVLSAAINKGIFFLASKNQNAECRIFAENLNDEISFNLSNIEPDKNKQWVNYIKGVIAALLKIKTINGINALFYGDLPVGAGLSSSAALEMSAGLALTHLFKININPLELAKIGQLAEHNYVGAKCGLLDQISSISGKQNHLIMTDFRYLKIELVPINEDFCFIICNTGIKHNLVDSEYNKRRHACEEATKSFARILPHPVRALRDVSWEEWEKYHSLLESSFATIAAHPIGENNRVLKGKLFLQEGNLKAFGKLMFESHNSSRVFFKNSCKELDFIVDSAKSINGVVGARLSGGGFGGSTIILCNKSLAETVKQEIANHYLMEYKQKLEIYAIQPSNGASIVTI